MTSQQITLVQKSYESLKPIAQMADELFYQNLFELAPQTKVMFKTPVAEQAGKLMYTLGYVVTHLSNPETILEDVRKLAIKHVSYGATPEHYSIVGAALLKTLEMGLSEQWNPNLKDAWIAAYTMVSTAMIDAADSYIKRAA